MGRIALTLVPALGAGLAPAAAAGPPARSATIQLSSSKAGARSVALTLQLSYEMQCGYPGPGPVLLAFPAAEHVPAAITPTAALVDGKAAPAVRVAGHEVSVGLPTPPRVMCDVIGPGRLTIVLTRSAGLVNPARAGTYTLTATRGAASFPARFAIR